MKRAVLALGFKLFLFEIFPSNVIMLFLQQMCMVFRGGEGNVAKYRTSPLSSRPRACRVSMLCGEKVLSVRC